MPDDGSTEPTAGLELDQTPPAVGFESEVVEPRQTVAIPVIVPGDATTVTTVVL
jgi:hypothetical protein